MRTLTVAAGICLQNARVLLSRRPEGKHLGGLWEFPGGKIEPGEHPEAALARELAEELGVQVRTTRPYSFGMHQEPQLRVVLLFFWITIAGTPRALEGNPVHWWPLHELDTAPMPPADRPVITQLQNDWTAGTLPTQSQPGATACG